MKLRSLSVLATAVLATGLLAAAPAQAAVVFNLNGDHCSGGCGTPPFGTVTLTQNGTTVDVDVDLFGTNAFAKTGAADFEAFKFNATGVVLGDITVNQNNPGETLAAQTGAFNGDGTGTFGFGIACTTCGNGSSDKFSTDIIFHVINATIADLTAPNSSGNVFVADIIGSTGNTGPVFATSSDDPTPAPEPTTFALLSSGLLGLGLLRRRNSA